MYSLQQLLRLMPSWRSCVPEGSHKVLSLIERCHTASLGYHSYRCSDAECGHLHIQYHGCRNRHCPHCGASRAKMWMEERLAELLPVKYFHVVFTLPHELKHIAYLNRKTVFKLLFEASAHCLLSLCKDKKRMGALPSITSVLHTWGQQLAFHPHLHCIVSAGGVDRHNNWNPLKKQGSGYYLFPYKVMEPLFKGFLLDKLNHLIASKEVKLPKKCNWKKLKDELYKKSWIIHANQPFGNVSQVIEYLGRYTQKVAISNHRIKYIDADNRVTFAYKDYADGGKRKQMTISGEEFIKRFAQHILPKRFVRIRHYGILGNHRRKERVAKILEKMKLPLHPDPVKLPLNIELLARYGKDITLCPKCQKAKLVLVSICFGLIRDGPGINEKLIKEWENV
jgi:hypothetical protein